jgi:hypothetical protein
MCTVRMLVMKTLLVVELYGLLVLRKDKRISVTRGALATIFLRRMKGDFDFCRRYARWWNYQLIFVC